MINDWLEKKVINDSFDIYAFISKIAIFHYKSFYLMQHNSIYVLFIWLTSENKNNGIDSFVFVDKLFQLFFVPSEWTGFMRYRSRSSAGSSWWNQNKTKQDPNFEQKIKFSSKIDDVLWATHIRSSGYYACLDMCQIVFICRRVSDRVKEWERRKG